MKRNTYARLQAFGLQAGSIAPHIIMDENHADFLIIGGGLAGNVLANRIYNACQSVGITMSGRYFEEQERSSIFVETARKPTTRVKLLRVPDSFPNYRIAVLKASCSLVK